MPRPSKYNCDRTNEFIKRHMDIVNERKKGYIKYLLQLMEEEEGFKITNVALYRRLRKLRKNEVKEEVKDEVKDEVNEEVKEEVKDEVKDEEDKEGPTDPDPKGHEK